MKKRLIIAIVLALVLSLTLVTSASANGASPVMCKAKLTYDLDKNYWSGSISGGVRGTMQMVGLDFAYPVEMVFTESFAITTRGGDIEGYVIGIFPGPAFSSCGWVTNATGRWSKMVNWMMYQSGKVTESGGTYVAKSYVVFMPPFPVK